MGWIASKKHRARELLNSGRDLLFPPTCLVCHRAIDAQDEASGNSDLLELLKRVAICTECVAGLVNVEQNFCRRCGGHTDQPLSIKVVDCRLCRDTRFRFASVTILGRYQDLLQSAVLRIKRSNAQGLARTLGSLFSHVRREQLAALQSNIVLPIPMHWTRRLTRGTNSPDVIAESLSRELEIGIAVRGIARRSNTHPQGELSETRRRANLRDAFRIHKQFKVEGARILLVDDILTTGATCDEAAKILLSNGAAQVDVAVLARSIPPTG
jgi:ComF family protein